MKRIAKGISLLICAVLMLSSTMTADAGSIINVLTKESFAKEIDNANWHNANGDVVAENGVLVFPKESSEETRLVWKTTARDSGIYDKLATANASLQFTALAEGKTFALSYGLKTVEAMSGDSGNVEITFSNQGGIAVSVIAFDDNGDEVVIAKTQKISASLKSNISIQSTLFSNGTISVNVAGKTICNKASIPVSGEGRIGFVQTGSCGVRVSDVNFTIYDYDSPENCNIDEDFDDGEYNKNELSVNQPSPKYYPSGAYITDYKGEKALIFQNSNVAYLTTKYKYSNFEMSYDVLYQKNEASLNENGEVVEKKMDNYLIRYGCDSDSMTAIRWEAGVYAGMLVVGNGSKIASGDIVGRSEEHLFGNAENAEKGYSVKLSMIDGELNVWIKWLEETEWTHMLTDNNAQGVTPNGFIQIIGQDGANVVFDNIKITNKDAKSKVIEPEYDSNIFKNVKDVEYEQQKVEYLPQETEEAVFNWIIIPPIALTTGILLVVITLYVLSVQRKRKGMKAGDVDEK